MSAKICKHGAGYTKKGESWTGVMKCSITQNECPFTHMYIDHIDGYPPMCFEQWMCARYEEIQEDTTCSTTA